jgi:SWI/SNF-related matrix-associated actin-dependent regulator 1 of chromatin subfamily A
MPSTLYQYQEEGITEVEKFNLRALISWEMSLGKTALSLHSFHRHPEIERCVVVCPAYLKWMWRREAMKHIDLEAEILGSTRPPKRRGLLFRSKLLIINYDVLYKWVDWLKQYDPHLVIADEVHFCCNPGARRSKSLEALCEGVPHVLALSGTPLVTRPIEIYMPTKIVCPSLFPSFQDFADKHCNPKKVMGTWTYKGATNLEELHEKLISSCMIRKRTEDVLPDLPPKIRLVVPLDPLNATEYNEATKEYLKHLKKNNLDYDKNWLTHLKRLAALSKLPQALEWIENYFKETDGKLIVFGIHYKVLDAVIERFSKIAIRVDGRVAPERREQIFEAFNTDSRLRLLAGNIDAAGTGWSCRSTSSVVFLEMPWAPGRLDQAEKRCFGSNRGLPGHPLRVWSLVAKGTCEEMLCQLLDSRQNVLSRVLDGQANEDDFNMFEALTKSIQKGE